MGCCHFKPLYSHNRNLIKHIYIFNKQSLLLTYNYQQKNLPNEILKLFDNSLHNNNILTRNMTKCSLKPKKELKRGNVMYEILNNWNETNKSIRDEPNLRAFKRKIMDFQNEFVKCNKENCYSCH